MLQFQTLDNKQIRTQLDKLMIFYTRYYETSYQKALENSALVCCCYDEGIVVGSCRLVTDYKIHAFIVDLIVMKSYRGQGIARTLMLQMLEEVAKLRIQSISIETDPRSPWLKNFYESLGFVSREHHHVLSYPSAIIKY